MGTLTATLLLCGAASLGACNTMAGLGEDTSSAGHALTNSAAQTSTSIDQATSNTPVGCATPLHQDLPGGTDYKGPPVPGCPGPSP
ncbi:MAG: entericidin A/B family lipoprotein [Alphaproteobacteria bacterium]|nr:entericidin A/B family lipoprotein [Alphaproteobacteria bacterium]